MIERLELIKNRYEELNKQLSDPEILSDINKTRDISKEIAEIKETVDTYLEYQKTQEEVENTKELMKDPELGEMAKLEYDEIVVKKEELESKLEMLLVPKDPNDGKNIIMEIRGAAGGDEANIFAGDLYRMYTRYAERIGFKTEVIDYEEGTAGGFSQIEFMVKGANVYSKLKYENGAHRVQRVPVTESQGRVQTSTATVLVMPEVEDVDITINPSDLRIDVYCASGHGGQGVNTTPSAVRITHLPTNTVVTCQNERSQIQNKEHCLEILKSKLYALELEKKNKQITDMKKGQMANAFGSGKRSYVLCPYTRVIDNDSKYETSNVEEVLDGNLDEFIIAGLRK